jgi:hypothetical protein
LFAIGPHGGDLVLCDNGYAGRDFQTAARERYGATMRAQPAKGAALAA